MFEFVVIIVREKCYNSNDYGMKIINFMYKINYYKPQWLNKRLILQILRNSRFTRYLQEELFLNQNMPIKLKQIPDQLLDIKYHNSNIYNITW